MAGLECLLVHLWSMKAHVGVEGGVVLETHAVTVHTLVYGRARVLQGCMPRQLDVCECLLRVVVCLLWVLRSHVLINVECRWLYTGVLHLVVLGWRRYWCCESAMKRHHAVGWHMQHIAMRGSKVHRAVYARSRLAPYVGEVVIVEQVIAPFLVIEDEFLGVYAMIPLSALDISIPGLSEAQ